MTEFDASEGAVERSAGLTPEWREKLQESLDTSIQAMDKREAEKRGLEERVRAMTPEQLDKAKGASAASAHRLREFLMQAQAAPETEQLKVEYELVVLCDHYQHPAVAASVRAVSFVQFVPNPAVSGWLDWTEAVMTDLDAALFGWQRSRQTYEQRLIELMGSLSDLDQRVAVFNDGDGLVTSRSTGRRMERVSWTFRCPDCTDTLPLTQAHAERAFEGLRVAGWGQVNLRELRDIAARR